VSSLTIKTNRSDLANALENFDVAAVHGVVDPANQRPIDALRSLRTPGMPAFILESESPEVGASRFSYVSTSIETFVRTGTTEDSGDINPLTALRSQFNSRSVAPIEELPSLITGAFGYVAYEAIKHFEPSVGELPTDPTGSPVSALAIPSELLVFDHVLNQLHVIVYVNSVERFDDATQRIEQIFGSLQTATPQPTADISFAATVDALSGNQNSLYPSMVSKAREAIIEGELIQVVLGQRVETATTADPVDIYEQLSSVNPSPYMYMLDLGDFQLIGASPELMLRSTNGKAAVHPIAGTRPRGTTAEEDLQYEADLLSNEKESAEHVMLVDLARNDLGRVSKPGSVNVQSLKHIERYSHVMHLVSRVEGELADGNDGIDAFEAGFPIGTLSGAPKIRSIQLIAELEPEGRGPYCGAIGWFAQNGDVDTGTVIRSIVLRDGTSHVQGGAGIVFDSDPQAEALESLQKMKAPLAAIARAEAIQERRWRSEEETPSENLEPATMQLTSD